MRIAYIAAGAGGMYCGACARDITLARGLIHRGHDVLVIPLYTPLRIDGDDLPQLAPIFYGGINVYLQQLSALFRHTPAPLTRLFDHPRLLNWAAGFAVKTHPKDLGALTVSVLAGASGKQATALRQLVRYLADEVQPDLVSITNTMLSAIAPALKTALGVPIVCAVQGEEAFIAAMPQPHRDQAHRLMRQHAHSIDAFIAPGERYAQVMTEYLGIPPQRMVVVPPGIDTRIYHPHETTVHQRPFTIGYLSVITPSKGLDVLVEAVRRLANDEGREVMLRIAGKIMNQSYWRQIQQRIHAAGLSPRVEYIGEVDLVGKLAFLQSCSIFVLPTRIDESRGIAVLEAMACGLPVVVPETGIFPEIMAATQGGMVCPPENTAALADTLAFLMDHPTERVQLGKRAAAGIARCYSADQLVDGVLREYSRLLAPPPSTVTIE